MLVILGMAAATRLKDYAVYLLARYQTIRVIVGLAVGKIVLVYIGYLLTKRRAIKHGKSLYKQFGIEAASRYMKDQPINFGEYVEKLSGR
jgi:hypothetical protein